LNKFREELRYLFIVSQVELEELAAQDSQMKVEVRRASGKKCERCWNYSERVGESDRYPEVCERCVIALAEIEADATSVGA
jgi:isoleucyl-tRNA synthetase